MADEVRVPSECEKVVVVFGRPDRRNGYFGWCGRARTHELAGPAKRFDGLVKCRRGSDGNYLWSLRFPFHYLDDFAIEPGRNRPSDRRSNAPARGWQDRAATSASMERVP